MSNSKIAIAFAGVTLVALVATTMVMTATGVNADVTDQCNVYPTCAQCIAAPSKLCGWCSTKVTYQSGAPGFQCAGFNPTNGSNNFTCNGVFSIDKCVRGYVCDKTNYTCVLGPAGGGMPLGQCQSNCTTIGKTFLCDNTTHQCKLAPAGQGTSFQVCQQQCSPQSTTVTQQTATATNSPASPSPHSSQAPSTTMTPLYRCDAQTHKCVAAKPGQGESLQVCQVQCKQSNHTPSALHGLWRGFAISNGKFTPDEYDFNFHTSSNTAEVIHVPGQPMKGTVTSIGDSFTIHFSGGKNASISCLFKQQNTQPTTYQALFACADGTKPPASFDAAMPGNASQAVIFLSRCVDASICQFRMDPGPKSVRRVLSAFAGELEQQEQEQQRDAVAQSNSGSGSGSGSSGPTSVPPVTTSFSDVCAAFSANCTYCIGQDVNGLKCGWCEGSVVGQNGTTLPPCVGFNPSGQEPWTCSGTYSTTECVPGWTCDAQKGQCVPSPAGSGIPSKSACDASCKAKPGPPSQLLGKYRGLLISKNYIPGVWRFEMNQTGFKEVMPDGKIITGTMKHFASYIFVNVTGQTQPISCIWSQNSDQFIEYVTFACSLPGGDVPKTFTGPMTKGSETIFAKCQSPLCKW